MLIQLREVCKSYGAAEILKDVSFIVEDREKVAVAGVNGAGKTTLLRLISGGLTPDSGEISIKKDIDIAYMPQNMEIDSDKTVYNEMLTVFDEVIRLEKNLRRLEGIMAENGADPEIMEKYHRDTHLFEEKNGYEYESRIRGVIKGLGFSGDEEINRLSGGEKTRVALGRILLRSPDILLLDEPTNHLDIGAVNWLEGFLSGFPGGVIVISHDRYFLDKIVTKVVEIENCKAAVYIGNYSDFAVAKSINREVELRHYLNQQKEIKRQQEIIRVLRSYNREKSVKRARSREKLLAKMEVIDKPEDLPDSMRFTLIPRIQSGDDVLRADNVSKSFGSRVLFTGLSFLIKKGEKVALIGPNGVGKTTLLRIILNRMAADEGRVIPGTNVVTAYYDQENTDINPEKTIYDEISDAYPHLTVTEIRNTLAAFIFTGDDVFKQISSLSGGEAGRVALARLMLGNANFLILDEPTNHLDIYSREILENAISSYEGTVLYVSHDRYFINSTADRILELTHVGLKQYNGNYDYYLEKKAQEIAAHQDAVMKESASKAVLTVASAQPGSLSAKDERAARKEEEAARRRRKNALARLEQEIEEMEAEAMRLESLLADSRIAADAEALAEAFDAKQRADEKIIELYRVWDELSEDGE